MRGPGLEGLEQWSEAAAPWLHAMRNEAAGTLGLPAFGFTREHQERLQAQAQAALRWQEALAAYNALMAKTSQDAYGRFESKLAEREEPGRQIDSVRGLFDLWVDAAEEAYAETALSPDYRKAYGELVNAQMQLRAATQAIAARIRIGADARFAMMLDGQSFDVSASRLFDGALSGNLGPIDSPAFRLHPLPRPHQWQWRGAIPLQPLASGDWLYVRMRQANGQWNWASPIFCE